MLTTEPEMVQFLNWNTKRFCNDSRHNHVLKLEWVYYLHWFVNVIGERREKKKVENKWHVGAPSLFFSLSPWRWLTRLSLCSDKVRQLRTYRWTDKLYTAQISCCLTLSTWHWEFPLFHVIRPLPSELYVQSVRLDVCRVLKCLPSYREIHNFYM